MQPMCSSHTNVFFWVTLARVLPGFSLSWQQQQLPEDGSVEGTEYCSVEVDDSPKGRSQFC